MSLVEEAQEARTSSKLNLSSEISGMLNSNLVVKPKSRIGDGDFLEVYRQNFYGSSNGYRDVESEELVLQVFPERNRFSLKRISPYVLKKDRLFPVLDYLHDKGFSGNYPGCYKLREHSESIESKAA